MNRIPGRQGRSGAAAEGPVLAGGAAAAGCRTVGRLSVSLVALCNLRSASSALVASSSLAASGDTAVASNVSSYLSATSASRGSMPVLEIGSKSTTPPDIDVGDGRLAGVPMRELARFSPDLQDARFHWQNLQALIYPSEDLVINGSLFAVYVLFQHCQPLMSSLPRAEKVVLAYKEMDVVFGRLRLLLARIAPGDPTLQSLALALDSELAALYKVLGNAGADAAAGFDTPLAINPEALKKSLPLLENLWTIVTYIGAKRKLVTLSMKKKLFS